MDPLRQLLDSTVSFTQLTRERAESIVSELVREGQVRTEEYQRSVQDLIDRSRESAERFNELVREQVMKVLNELGLVPARGASRAASTAKASAAKKSAAKKSAKKSTKKGAARKTTAKSAATSSSGAAAPTSSAGSDTSG